MPGRTSALQQQADALYRAAAECHRQHVRYARLVELGASEDEQRSALEMAFICDDDLGSAISAYESAAARGGGSDEDAWWHKGNMLWHMSKKYIGRHDSCNGMARRLGRRAPDRLAQLALAFDLEASALLALRMAAEAYRAVRPEAE